MAVECGMDAIYIKCSLHVVLIWHSAVADVLSANEAFLSASGHALPAHALFSSDAGDMDA